MLFVTILSVFVSYSDVFAGSSKGIISGKVTDRSTAQPIPYASIILDSTAIGGISDASGNYSILNIPVGSYSVKFVVIGYRPLVKTDVIVSSQRTTNVDAELEETAIDMEEVAVTPDYFEKNHETPPTQKAWITRKFAVLRALPKMPFEQFSHSPVFQRQIQHKPR
jgi:hypothetical protein